MTERIAVMDQYDFYLASPYLPSRTVLGQPLVSIDGRCACCHPFTEDDEFYLIEHFAMMVDVLPKDFVMREDDV